jgi:hypothetical protein
MSLVVGAIDRRDAALVADTKITLDGGTRPPAGFGSVEAANRAEYGNSLPKIVVLDRSLAVGYAGEDAVGYLKQIVALLGQGLDEVLNGLSKIAGRQFVVLSARGETQLWQIRDGVPEDRTTVRRAWAGDPEAYELFQGHWHLQSPDESVELLASAALQFPISFGAVSTVGGFMTQSSSVEQRTSLRSTPGRDRPAPDGACEQRVSREDPDAAIRGAVRGGPNANVHLHICWIWRHARSKWASDLAG